MKGIAVMLASTGRLIYVDGIDGAGKSTALQTLRERHHDGPLLFLGKARFQGRTPDEDAYLRALNAIVYQRPRHVADRCGDQYWLYAVAAWYQLLDTLVVRPAVADGRTVIMDNSPLKILTRYLVADLADHELIRQCFASLLEPDLVLILAVSPEEALRRKGFYTTVEAAGTQSEQEFLALQAALGSALAQPGSAGSHTVASTSPRRVIDTTGRPAAEVADEVWRHIAGLAQSSPQAVGAGRP